MKIVSPRWFAPSLFAATLFTCYCHALPITHDARAATEDAVINKTLLFTDNGAENRNIHIFDESQLAAESLAILKQRDERAYEYLFGALETLHGGLRELGDAGQLLRQLADDSLTSMVPMADYLAAVRAYEQLVPLIEDRITTLSLLPSLKEDKRSDLSAEIRFDALKDHYFQQLERLRDKVNGLTFRLLLPNETPFVQMGINLENLRGLQLLSAEQINEMQRKIVRKRAMTAREKNVIDQGINAFTESALNTFIEVFGSSQRYRTSSNEQGRQEAAQALAQAFWARFYIRATYGIKIGSVPVHYDKSIFNADYLLSDMKIGAVPVWSQTQLTGSLDQAREAQATLKDGGQSWATFIRNLSVWIGGSQAAESAKRFVIDLIYTDIEQELKLGHRGGLHKVREAYRQKFYSSESAKAHYKQQEDLVFGAVDEDDPEADVGTVEAGTLQGVIATCINTLEQMEVRLEEANQLQNALELVLGENQIVKRRQKRSQL